MSRRSFTLLEVLIAIALVLALLGSMFGFLFNLLSTREAASELSMRQRVANVLLERVERDLIASLVGDDARGPGVKGDATSLRLLTRSIQISAEGTPDRDRLMLADLQRVEYRFDESLHRLQAGRAQATAANQKVNLGELDAEIFRVRFRYYDGTEFSNAFDSLAAGRLPVAVEVSIWFDPWPGETMRVEDPDDAPMLGPADDRMPDRRTFDLDGGFDEVEAARLSDLDLDDEPAPDRLRLIIIPDAGGGDA